MTDRRRGGPGRDAGRSDRPIAADAPIRDLPHRPGAEGKRLDIQGLRALAVVAVLGFHSTEVVRGGFLGVDVFFVISGYIITWMALRERRRSAAFDARSFIVRRVRRLAPAMLVVVAAATVAAMVLDTPVDLATRVPRTAATALLGVSNVHFYVGAVDYFQSFELDPLLNTWSLAVEVQFYGAFALVGWAALRLRTPLRRVALWLIATVSVGSLGLALVLLIAPDALALDDPAAFSFFLPATRLWQFGCGALAALLPRRRAPTAGSGRGADVASGLLLAVIAASMVVLDDAGTVPGVVAVPPTLATALLLRIGAHHQGAVQQLLAHPTATALGDRSYSIYLWQGPLIVFATMLFSSTTAVLTAAAASVLLGAVTFRHVEQRFRSERPAAGGPASSSRPGVLRGAVAYLAVVAVLWTAGTALRPVITRLHGDDPVRATMLDDDCLRQRADGAFLPCRYGPPGRPIAVLAGDSHAAALSEAFIAAAADAGLSAVVATGSACAPYDLPQIAANRPACAGYGRDVLGVLAEEEVAVLVLHHFSEFYTAELGIGVEGWSRATAAFAAQVRERGVPVVVLGDTPRGRSAAARPFWSDRWSLDLSDSIAVRERIGRAEAAALATVPGARYEPSAPVFCPRRRCEIFGPDGWGFTDRDHLSVTGAARLEEHLHGLLVEARR